jgi:hypothetical protein
MARNSSQPAPSAKPSTTSQPPRSSAEVLPGSGRFTRKRRTAGGRQGCAQGPTSPDPRSPSVTRSAPRAAPESTSLTARNIARHPSSVAYLAAVDADEVADELYGLPPEQFTAARNARAKEAKAAGDSETAARIAALRKPTVLAWLVNLLVRELPDEIGGFLDLGDALREATATLSGPVLRQLSGQRHRLVQALVRQARELARQTGYRITEDVA